MKEYFYDVCYIFKDPLLGSLTAHAPKCLGAEKWNVLCCAHICTNNYW